MKKSLTSLITLDGGLRLVHMRAPGAGVDYCGVIARAGARDDLPALPGLAHFVEHTIFKGTERRSAWHILNRMERVGGELNAYTTKEETVVYTAAPAGTHARAFELLADLVTASRFPEKELRKERDVVAEEINSYLDSPADAILDDVEDLVYSGTPLGHNILGTEQSLPLITSEACREYLQRWFTAANVVVFYSGPASESRVAAAVAKYFATLPPGPSPHREHTLSPDFTVPPFCVARDHGLHQCHVAMVAAAPSMHSPERHAYCLLNNILGGPGMNSLLNLDLREHRGLVYTIESTLSLLSDTGLMCIYFGCDPDDAALCRQLVAERLTELASKPLKAAYVAAAQKQYIGQIAVADDSRDSHIISHARCALNFGSVLAPDAAAQAIRAVTPEQLRAAAERMASPSTLIFT